MVFSFRKEVFAARQQERFASMHLQPPRAGWVFFGVGMLIITLILALLLCGHYTRHTQVSGILVPDRGLLTSRADRAGIVTHLFVHEGDTVHEGQPLLEISVAQDSAQLGDTQIAIAQQLHVKQNRLKADVGELEAQTGLQRRSLADQLHILKLRINRLSQQIRLQKIRARSARDLYAQWLDAGKHGVVSKLRLLQQRDTSLQEQMALKDLQAKQLQLRQSETLLLGQLQVLPGKTAQQLNSTQRQLADVAQSMARNAQQSAIVLRAHASGEIATVMVHPAQQVRTNQPLLALLPEDSKLRALLWVPNKSIGFIRPGIRVFLRYQAYPYQKFGQYQGTVRAVSWSAVSPKDIQRMTNIQTQEPMFRVDVDLPRQSVTAYGRRLPLKPDMTVDADLQLDRRSLIEWILEPLYGLRARYAGHADEKGKANG